jgi:hypothetical protein
MQELLPRHPSGTMNAAAPGGTPPRRIGDKKIQKKLSARRASKESLRLRSIVEKTIFMVLVLTDPIHVCFKKSHIY